MTCPRCDKSHSYELTFKLKHKGKNCLLEARVCKVCEYVWADDEELLKAARNALKLVGNQNKWPNNNSNT